MNILVTGASGQLGSEIKELSLNYTSFKFFFEDSKSLDITNADLVANYIEKNKIDRVINCAAYTNVDEAEEALEEAEKVNVFGVENLVNSIKSRGGKLIHISTDYVFNGESFLPYKEEDNVAPLGVYGNTKRRGEEIVESSLIEAIVIRTSWVYSSYGNNFVKTMMRLGEEKESLGVIYDQIGTPTYARDLAKVCLHIISLNRKIDRDSKIYHFSNEGVASWYDFAKAIMEFGNISCVINPIEAKDYKTLAKRPHYSVLNKQKIKSDFTINIPYWRDSLKKCILNIKKEK
ncbi:dTDP-4-dehydrorhamnose reductase [Tenacibaculum lutimaris]|uniref:dTDP-4-dehydrorhamnose reductase n=1 Tax=Tenacibaculum lutimaris TaxID=285258 RepID=A0A420DYC8_9FLAO|nr:dTDP-4-dehydrorhamnose reductase [Tenacibaculum lutimaris]RKF02802.1 dTDP-4-dehydrorhamnose reductase [Tenacibaculum lutimaris]